MLSRSRGKPHGGGKTSGGEGIFSFLGVDAILTGTIVTTAGLQVNGRIDGDVRCASLHLGPSGTIVGAIVAEEARLEGLTDGTVTARALTLDSTARVTGDVVYETLSIAPGARIDGSVSGRDEVALETPSPKRVAAPLSFTPAERAAAVEARYPGTAAGLATAAG
jgi:cytoskeletal protein CcmA (bactofilin family)